MKHDDDFETTMRNVKRTTKAIGVAMALWSILCLAGFVGVVIVAIHFIQKAW
jgi:hypothetical protein